MDDRSRRPQRLSAGLGVAAAMVAIASALHAQPSPPGATAHEIVSIALTQTHVRPPTILVYLHANDPDNRLVTDPGDAQLSATVAGAPVEVTAVRPFDASDGIAYLFLVDTSRSVQPRQFLGLRDALRDRLTALGPQDQAAVVGFGDSMEVLADFTSDRDELGRGVDALELTGNQTRFHDAMLGAFDLVERNSATLPDRRVIVVVSDGQHDIVGGVSEREVFDRIQATHVPVFGIGLYDPPRTPAKERGLETLGAMARASGGHFVRADEMTGSDVLALVSSHATDVLVAELACAGCPRDGQVHRLQVTAQTGARTVTAGTDVRLFSPAAVRGAGAPLALAPWWQRPWGIATLVAALVAIAAGVLATRRKPDAAPSAAGAAGAAIQAVAGPGVATPAGTGGPIEPAPAVSIRLTPLGVTSSHEDARNAVLTDRIVIGRSHTESDVAFPGDPEISSAHCALLLRDSRVVVCDLNSTNGTLVNGVPVRSQQRLDDDDIIAIGQIELRVSISGADDDRHSR